MTRSIAVVGHVTRDVVRLGDAPPRRQPGGAACYAAMALAALGARVTLATRLAQEDEHDLLADLRAVGVRVHERASPRTTTFHNDYDRAALERTQRVTALADPIAPDDLPSGPGPAAWMLGPVTPAELPFETVRAAQERGGWIALDGQGLLRALDGDRVVPHAAADLDAFLAVADVLKLSEAEAGLLCPNASAAEAAARLADRGPGEVAVTCGARGAALARQGDVVLVPACPTDRAVDPTGCGDTWLAAYLLERLDGTPPDHAARRASAAATLTLERRGALRADRQTCVRRARECYGGPP